MSQESSATELEVAMLYSQALAESDDEDDVFLRALHEGVAAAKSLVDERKAAARHGGGASSVGSAAGEVVRVSRHRGSSRPSTSPVRALRGNRREGTTNSRRS